MPPLPPVAVLLRFPLCCMSGTARSGHRGQTRRAARTARACASAESAIASPRPAGHRRRQRRRRTARAGQTRGCRRTRFHLPRSHRACRCSLPPATESLICGEALPCSAPHRLPLVAAPATPEIARRAPRAGTAAIGQQAHVERSTRGVFIRCTARTPAASSSAAARHTRRTRIRWAAVAAVQHTRVKIFRPARAPPERPHCSPSRSHRYHRPPPSAPLQPPLPPCK